MKKIIIVFTLIVLQVQVFAQFNAADYGKFFDCTIIFKSGETKKLYIRYHHPGVLMGAANPLETQSEAYIDKGLIEVFYLNGQCWVERSTPVGKQWVLLVRQGGIEHITYITTAVTTTDGTTPNATVVTGDMISKNGQSETSSSMILGYKKKMSQFISDYPELAAKVSNGEKGYGFITYLNVVDEYNTWFEKTNPGKTKYYPWFGQGKKTEPASIAEVQQAIQQNKDSVANARKALAASRPAVPAVAIASKKANVPPKKETFTAKVKRYEAEGHKIAVTMEEQKTKVTATIGASNVHPKNVGFEGDPEKELVDEEILNYTVNELNRVYGTTIFEAVPINQIPLVEVKSYKVDDWWSTCYKTLVSVSHIRGFSCSNDVLNPGGFGCIGSIGLYANVFEYIDDEKKSKDAVKRLYVLAYGMSESAKYTEKDFPITFEKLESMVNWGQVKERYEKKRQEQFAKLVEKWD